MIVSVHLIASVRPESLAGYRFQEDPEDAFVAARCILAATSRLWLKLLPF